MLLGFDFEAAAVFRCMLLFVQLFASRALSRCKHDMGTLSWLNAEPLERAPTPLFDRLVRCSAHGLSFVRLRYMGHFCKLLSLEVTSQPTSHRAVAAGPVSPVSTGPLFPSPWLAWRCQNSAIALQTPTHGSQVHSRHAETCEMATNSAKKLVRVFQQLFVLPSLICEGCGLQG